ncbi:MAG: DUF4838 domain-containing protein [Verrucomicrobia bacterium]|nr:DUF4838 domain-containing protein [Verrucomicrobiota bacterium]
MKKFLIWAAVVATALGAEARVAELVLVEKGVSKAPIIVAQDAPPMTRRAADELAGYIEKMSGAKLQVIEGEPKPVPAHAIWIGCQPKPKELFPRLSFGFKHPEEILVAANENHLVIAGRDVWDPKRLTVAGRHGRVINGWQEEYGTVNAVYTFLQDYLGVRWLWPGETGEDVLKRDTIAFAPFDYRYHPQIRWRSGILFPSAPADGRGISQDWTRLQRVQLDSCGQRHQLMRLSGAGFEDWWKRFHETHPEYFALQPDGTRTYHPDLKPDSVKICHSNPAVWERWLADVEEQLRENPAQTVFNAAINDGTLAGHCICEKCRAWDHPDGEKMLFVWKGASKKDVSLSDRNITFANTVARMLKARYPGRELYVTTQAYGNWRTPPVKAVPDDNVIVQCVTNFLLFSGQAREEALRWHRGWAAVSRQIYWRPNLHGRWWQGLPEVPLRQIIEDFQFVARNKCMGIFLACIWENWATQGPAYYAMAQLAWNPNRDAQAMMEDYYRRGFGPAASDIKSYWKLMEDAYHQRADKDAPEASVYDAAFFAKAGGILDRADAALAGQQEVFRKRVALVRAGLEYTRRLTEIRLAMERLKKSKRTDAAADKTARTNWDKLKQLCKANPTTMNWNGFSPDRAHMKTLHPDYELKR